MALKNLYSPASLQSLQVCDIFVFFFILILSFKNIYDFFILKFESIADKFLITHPQRNKEKRLPSLQHSLQPSITRQLILEQSEIK